MSKPIATLPNGDPESCSICDDENIVLVIRGQTNCHYCGNAVALCRTHLDQLIMELVMLPPVLDDMGPESYRPVFDKADLKFLRDTLEDAHHEAEERHDRDGDFSAYETMVRMEKLIRLIDGQGVDDGQ